MPENNTETGNNAEPVTAEEKKIIFPLELSTEYLDDGRIYYLHYTEDARGTYKGVSRSFKSLLEEYGVKDDDLVAFRVNISDIDDRDEYWESEHLANIRSAFLGNVKETARAKYGYFQTEESALDFHKLMRPSFAPDGEQVASLSTNPTLKKAILEEALENTKADPDLKNEFELYVNDRFDNEAVEYFNSIRRAFIEAGFKPLVEDVEKVCLDIQHNFALLTFYGTKKQLLEWDAGLVKPDYYVPHYLYVSMCGDPHITEDKPYYESLSKFIDEFAVEKYKNW
ncbi:MAG: hypothetical protein KBT31_02215 [Firmicutes bacterium]|nr:hypothetical protein [Candidatus Colimorpha enterica]